MRSRPLGTFCLIAVALAGSVAASPATESMAPQPVPAPTRQQQPGEQPQAAAGPELRVETSGLNYGDEVDGVSPYWWTAKVENLESSPVVVKIRFDHLDAQGNVVRTEWLSSQVGPNSAVTLQQSGTVESAERDRVVGGRSDLDAWFADEPYKFRTVAAFVDGLSRLEVLFVLEDWSGRPVTANGAVDLYVVERERLRADFAGGGMQRPISTLYARRFQVNGHDFARRRIGFINNDYNPPTVTLGPIHYTIFDSEPIGDEGLVRVVFHTASGHQIVGEDRVFF